MLIEDKVIIDPESDELGRKSLVELFAKSVIAKVEKNHGPLTFGILGTWGEGKSSFMRMVQTSLKDKVETIWYNPWEVSDEKRMTYDFFSMLAGFAFDSQSVNDAMCSYGRAFLSHDDQRLLSPVLADSVGRLTKCIPFMPNSFSKVKKEISKQLRDAQKHLVVFIDDIDRLDEKEVHTIFKLIRQVADFDNVIYIIGMDSEVVSAILAQGIDEKKETGRTYLSKIIQVPFVLPPIKEEVLKKLITTNLVVLVNDNDIKVSRNEIDEVASFASKLLKTKRDIIRYTNQLSFVLPIICKETEFVDLCALELIKYQDEQGWLAVYNNKDLLFALGGPIKQKEREEIKKQGIEHIVNKFQESKRSFIYFLLSSVLFGKNYSPVRRSVNNQVYFAQYFVCGVPEDIIPHEEVLELKRCIEGVNQKGILQWLNSKAKRYAGEEVDRACRTMMYTIEHEGKSTEKASLTLCRMLAKSSLAERYTFASIGNPNTISLTISSVLIPHFMGRRTRTGEMRVNQVFEAKVLSEIYNEAPLNFAVNVLCDLYSSNAILPADEKSVFDILKRRIFQKNKLYPFNYSCVLQDVFFSVWRKLDEAECSGYFFDILSHPKFDVGKLIVDWMKNAGALDSNRSNAVNKLTSWFRGTQSVFLDNLDRSSYKDDKLVRFFKNNSSVFMGLVKCPTDDDDFWAYS